MLEEEKTAFEILTPGVNKLISAADEGAVLAITASYLAGKEAGRKEALVKNTPG